MIRERGWEKFAAYGDEVAAKVVADYLQRNDCPAQVTGDFPQAAAAQCARPV
jgi:hypothetical protein